MALYKKASRRSGAKAITRLVSLQIAYSEIVIKGDTLRLRR